MVSSCFLSGLSCLPKDEPEREVEPGGERGKHVNSGPAVPELSQASWSQEVVNSLLFDLLLKIGGKKFDSIFTLKYGVKI